MTYKKTIKLFPLLLSFVLISGEKKHLLKNSKKSAQQEKDDLSALPLPILLNIGEYCTEKPNDIKALAVTSKKFNIIFGTLTTLESCSRSEKLEQAIFANVKATKKTAAQLLKYAQEKKITQSFYDKLSYEPNFKDNCQDCFACAPPWGNAWNKARDERFNYRMQKKYGIDLENPTQHRDYQGFKKDRDLFLGICLRLGLGSVRTLTQIALCPLCFLSLGLNECCCPEDFEEGNTFFGWLFFPLPYCLKNFEIEL